MSVLVKDMKMPTGCMSCDFCNPFVDEPYCRRLMRKVPATTRLKDCPLIPVPHHGRLIDAEELKVKQQEDADLFINAYTLMEKSRRDEALNAAANIVNAPTVIEAEEGE